ncbi:MAG: hypothetical protein Q7J47_04185 [Azoarcus sp.]|nr:hypothetical protein [Azoarcus sp.]
MKFGKGFSAVLVMSALLVAVTGCQKEGPAEKAGKSVDQTIEKAGDSIKDAVDGNKK